VGVFILKKPPRIGGGFGLKDAAGLEPQLVP